MTASDEISLSELQCQLIALQIRFDTSMPTLATKADIAELRAEMQLEKIRATARMQDRLLATLIGIALASAVALIATVTLLRQG